MNTKNMDVIRIDGLVIHANHGVLEEENRLGQRFIISAKLYGALSEAKKTDNVENTVNYAKVCDLIEKITQEKTYNLIEALAHTLAFSILEKFTLLDEVEITVKKPFAPIRQALDMVSVTVREKRHIAYLSLGSNIGVKEEYLNKAINKLNEDSLTKVTKIASFIETEPYGNVEQDKFINTALEVKTLRTPEGLLNLANEIEAELGRERIIHWGPRTIDIDIIFYDDIVINTENLIIPHKEMHLREFVLEPLCEINPTLVHPVLGSSVYILRELLLA